MSPEPQRIECADGFTLAGFWRKGSRLPPAGVVVIAPALGVPQRFYAPLAEFLSGAGYDTLTFDYRGVDESGSGSLRGRDMRLRHWGELDFDAALGFAHERSAGRLFLVGHSAGGQLFALARNSRYLSGLVMVSSLIPWWGHFPQPQGLGLWLIQRLLLPLGSLGRDRFPARRLGISSVDVAAGVAREWARWSRRRNYFFDPRFGLDLHRYEELAIPILVAYIDDDEYAPRRAVDDLLSRLPRCTTEPWEIHGADAPGGHVGHVDFFRPVMREALWGHIAEWLEGIVRARDSVASSSRTAEAQETQGEQNR